MTHTDTPTPPTPTAVSTRPPRWPTMAKVLGTVALTAVTIAVAQPAQSREDPAGYTTLRPGQSADLRETVPVNVVLLGYDPAAVDAGKLVAGLPRTGRPIHRLPTRLGEGAGKPASTLGIEYTFDYRVHDTDRGYEDRFFAMLRSTGQRKPLTEAQQEYNGQKRRSATVTSNLEIDARAVERYLALQPPAGVDTRRHTVFLVNWWGRKDFRFHEYAATGDPDPDTGVDAGTWDAFKGLGWGGTTADDPQHPLGARRRVWFHDLSAGPDRRSSSFNVDDADTDGDGTADYRIPPAWEYRRGGYRAPSALTADLAKLVRYAAVDVQFASSPGSFAQPAAYGLVRAITIDVTTYRGTTKLDDALDTDRLRDAVQRLNPLTPVTVRHRTAAFDARNRRCYELLMTEEEPKACPGSPAPEQNLFSYHHRQGIRPRVDAAGTLTVPVFAYALPDELPVALGGLTDLDPVTGEARYVYAFSSDANRRETRHGFTGVLIHELGHFFGLSHTADGYDYASRTAFDGTGPSTFAAIGQYSGTVMQYLSNEWDYSQFNRDDRARWLTEAYHAHSNALAATLPAGNDRVLHHADRLLTRSAQQFAAHDHLGAQASATAAYAALRSAAAPR